MPNTPAPRPDIFSRGSLKMTYDLLRKPSPELALTVRNITGGEPLTKTETDVDNPHSDHFQVTLDSFQVRSVVETLATITQSSDTGTAIMAKTLMQDWLQLAQYMISQLPNHSD